MSGSDDHAASASDDHAASGSDDRAPGGSGAPLALVVGAGPGLSASFARLLAAEGYRVALAARTPGKLDALAREIGGTAHVCDAADPAQVAALFDALGDPAVVLYNASFRVRGPVVALDPAAVRRTLDVTAFGAFLVAQAAARRMLASGRGTILLTGASAGVKGFAQSAPFAMGKFALRGLSQSLSRELHPQGVHVIHVVVDGGIGRPGVDGGIGRPGVDGGIGRPGVDGGIGRPGGAAPGDATLDPDAIARTMLDLVAQPRSCWTDEIAVRPWVERF